MTSPGSTTTGSQVSSPYCWATRDSELTPSSRLDVLATDMRVEQRSLEDVFLDLTGRELRS